MVDTVAMANLRTQLGVESVAGTPVATTLEPRSFGLLMKPAGGAVTVRGAGRRMAQGTYPVQEHSTGALSGFPDYNELAYLFSAALGTAGISGAGAAKTWVWTPSAIDPYGGKYYTIENGDSGRARRASSVRLSALGLAWKTNGFDLSGAAVGAPIEDDVTITAGAAPLAAAKPVAVGSGTFYLDTTAAGIGGTKLLAVHSWDWNATNLAAPVFRGDKALGAFQRVRDDNAAYALRAAVEADDQGMALLGHWRTVGTVLFHRATWVGPLIEGTDFYTLTLDLALGISDVVDLGDTDGVHDAIVTFACLEYTQAGAWVNPLTVTLKNTLAAL